MSRLRQALAGLSETEWDALYDALDQYTTNVQDFLDTTDADEVPERTKEKLDAAQGILTEMSLVIADLAK